MTMPGWREQGGTTIVELLVYLGVSTLVVMVMMSFTVGISQRRAMVNDQLLAQENGRLVAERMAYVLRNSYRQEVRVVGSTKQLIVTGLDPAQPTRDLITVFEFSDGTIKYAQASGAAPPSALFAPMIDRAVVVDAADVENVSAATVLRLTLRKGNQRVQLESTVGWRQT